MLYNAPFRVLHVKKEQTPTMSGSVFPIRAPLDANLQFHHLRQVPWPVDPVRPESKLDFVPSAVSLQNAGRHSATNDTNLHKAQSRDSRSFAEFVAGFCQKQVTSTQQGDWYPSRCDQTGSVSP